MRLGFIPWAFQPVTPINLPGRHQLLISTTDFQVMHQRFAITASSEMFISHLAIVEMPLDTISYMIAPC